MYCGGGGDDDDDGIPFLGECSLASVDFKLTNPRSLPPSPPFLPLPLSPSQWHKRGAVILAGSTDATTWMWSAVSGDCMQVFAGHEDSVTCGSFTANGKQVVTGSMDSTIRIWAPKTGVCKQTFTLNKADKTGYCHGWHTSGITTLACHPDADKPLVLTGSCDGTSRLVHVQSKKMIGTLQHRREGDLGGHSVEAVGFSNAHAWAVTAGSAGLANVWDLNTLKVRHELRHEAAIIRAKFIDQSPLLATCSVDQSVKVWDTRSGECVRELLGHHDQVLDLDAVKGGGGAHDLTIVAASDDKTCRVFRV